MMGKLTEFLAKIGLIRARGIHYIGGSDVLPPPLKGQDEQSALERLEQGDEAAKQLLIEHNLRLVVYIARRFENTGILLEDLISIGTIGLMKAIGTYRLDKKIKLATYASRCIENEILMHIRKTAKEKTEVSLDEPINMDGDGNELLLGDILGTEEDVVLKPLEEDVDLSVLRQSLGELPQRERELINMRYGLEGRRELTQKEAAQQMGISQSYISRLEKRIMQRLKKEFIRKTSCA
jgi:RNA polymerase sporulation-specific sigma factor